MLVITRRCQWNRSYHYMILEETLGNTRKHMPFDSVSQPLKITQLSLADVLAAVQTADLPNRQRQELASALRTVGRAFDRPLERIQADQRHLAPRLKAVAPRAIGMSPRSWNNIRHRTRKALSLVRPMSPGRNTNP